MTRKLSGITLVICLLFSACFVEFEPPGSGGSVNTEGYGDFTGSVFGTARGYHSDIKVTLTFESGKIVKADIISVPGTGSESENFGVIAMKQAPAIIVARNSVELDALSGATITTNAIVAAGRAAIANIPAPGVVPEVNMKPGMYRKPAAGGYGETFYVQVTVSKTAITEITVETSSEGEAGKLAIPMLISRIILAQNSGVDGVSGATLTSNALKSAVTDALTEAEAPYFMMQPAKPEPGTKPKSSDTVDVLIIGSGAAGLSAAIEASKVQTDPPLSVMLIEKQDLIGGSTKISRGVIYAPVDNNDKATLKEYFLFRAQTYADSELLEKYVNNSLDLVDGSWELPELTEPFSSGMASARRARVVPGEGAGIVRILEGKARERGVTILTGVKATALAKNSSGEVVRVLAESKDTDYEFNVRRGVVIATGGFDNNPELVARNNPNIDKDNFFPRSSKGNVGEGITMAEAVGAQTVFKGGMIGWGIVDPGVMADIPGSSNIVEMSNVISSSWDAYWLDTSPPPAVPAAGDHPQLPAISSWIDGKHNVSGPDQRDPSDDMGIMFARLIQIPKYRFLQISSDPFPPIGAINITNLIDAHKGFFGVSTITLGAAIGHGISAPFDAVKFSTRISEKFPSGYVYAWFVRASSIGSMGGLKINANAQVYGKAGTSGLVSGMIPGLFAAGESANGDFYYQQYPAQGSSLALALTFGRIAGKNAAESKVNTLLP